MFLNLTMKSNAAKGSNVTKGTRARSLLNNSW